MRFDELGCVVRLFPHEVAIGILGDRFEEGLFPDPQLAFKGKGDALRFLRELTGEDYGLNAEDWDAWFRKCPTDLHKMLYDDYNRRKQTRWKQGEP